MSTTIEGDFFIYADGLLNIIDVTGAEPYQIKRCVLFADLFMQRADKSPNAQSIKRAIAKKLKEIFEYVGYLENGELDLETMHAELGEQALKHIEPFTNLILE